MQAIAVVYELIYTEVSRISVASPGAYGVR